MKFSFRKREVAAPKPFLDYRLPAGITPSNDEAQSSFAADTKSKTKTAAAPQDFKTSNIYRAPDVATPVFDGGATQAQPTGHYDPDDQRDVKRLNDDDYHSGGASPARSLKLPSISQKYILGLGAVVLLFVAGAFLLSRSGGATPLCESLPEWNQFNCRR